MFKTGERLVDRVDFEEISLKTVDPSLGPTLLGGELSERDGRKMVDSKVCLISILLHNLFRSLALLDPSFVSSKHPVS